ncbi:hypothetical protein [Azospira sp. I09]|jgi:hypothetical protein|uniref:hypothetical protein n=1 Tax=Azospira sp. I09 TaxID=1765049 RepID=UPI001260C3DA|nr:hypothetical protein [Azospira sp. I09]BBN88855.1 hypothetical protein AZSP09_18780 [Azospira sp. I09]
MPYHILEVQKVDEDGRVLSREYFVVNEEGDVIDGPFITLAAAVEALKELEAEDAPPPPGGGSGPGFHI